MSELALFVVSVVIAFWLLCLAILTMFSAEKSYDEFLDHKNAKASDET